MARIEEKFAELAGRGEKALAAYVMAGVPDYRATAAAVRGLVRGGADIVELGFPFSDPLADGPVIQRAATGALARGAGLDGYLEAAGRIRAETDVPLVCMTYANVAHRRGYARFAREARRAGIDGVILPDMPVEEAGEYLGASGGIDRIFLASPNTPAARLKKIAAASSGFMYLVAVYGTTGASAGVQKYTLDAIRRAKRAAGGVPVGAGFGVSGRDDVRRYARAGADAVIVGSAIVRAMESAPRGAIEGRMAGLARRLKEGTR